MKSDRIGYLVKIGYGLIFLAFVILIVRSFFGFCWSDESFYLSTVHRLYQGDRLLVDEWNPAQFYAVLLLPFYRLYLWIVGSTDGVYLAARILSNVMIFGIAIYLYRVLLKRYSAVSALLCAYLYMFYSRSNVDGLSYHNLTLSFAICGIIILFDVFVCEGKWQNMKLFLCGIAFGCMVVCNPYQVVAYMLASLTAGVFFGRKKGFKRIGMIWAGTIFAAILYLLWLFVRQDIGGTLGGLPNAFQDADHGGIRVVWRRFKSWFRYQNDHYGVAIKMTFFLWVIAIVRRFFVKGKGASVLKLLILLLDMIVLGYAVAIGINIFGGIFISIMLCGSVLFLLLDSVSMDAIWMLLFFYVPGIIISGLQHMASNTWLEAIPVGLVIASVASVVWGELLLGEMEKDAEGMKWGKIVGRAILYVAAGACALVVVAARIKCVYRDDVLRNLTKRIGAGPAKGVYTSEEHYEQYMAVYHVIRGMEADGSNEKYLFCSELAPWVYLCTDMRCGAYTTWRTALDDERLLGYYEGQGWFPDYVLVLDKEYGSYVTDNLTNMQTCDDANENSYEGGFADVLTDELQYEKMRVECGTLYKKRLN